MSCGSLTMSLSAISQLSLAAAAHLSRYRGTSRTHTESDLRIFITWCQERHLVPLDAKRNDLELYLRWMQEVRRFKPSTVSRRLSVITGFYRTCAIDGVLEHSPADYVRRPTVPPESPTLGLTHLQFEAMLTAARQSSSPLDFALVCLLGLLGSRIFETVGTDIDDLGEEHGHRVLRVRGKGGKVVLVPLPPAVSRAVDRAAGDRTTGALLLNRRGASMDRHAATRRLRHLATDAGVRLPACTHTCCDTRSSPRCSTPASTCATCKIAARHADPRTTMRYDRARKNLDRHPNYMLAAYMAPGT
jgi:integrase/recombinase XerD